MGSTRSDAAGHNSPPALGAVPTQQQVECASAPVARLCRRNCKDLSPQLHSLKPSWNGPFEHSRPSRTETSAGNDEHAPPPGFGGTVDERSECVMRFGFGLSVQIEPGLDPVETALETLGVGPVDSGEMVEG